MDDAFLDKREEAIADLLQQLQSSFLRDVGVAVDVLFQIRVADLLDDVIVVAAFHHIQNLDDVVGFEELKNLYL